MTHKRHRFDPRHLKELCDASGRSMREISLAAGLSDTYISQLLRDEDPNPSWSMAAAIAEELSVTVSGLAYGADDGGPLAEAARFDQTTYRRVAGEVAMLAIQCAEEGREFERTEFEDLADYLYNVSQRYESEKERDVIFESSADIINLLSRRRSDPTAGR